MSVLPFPEGIHWIESEGYPVPEGTLERVRELFDDREPMEFEDVLACLTNLSHCLWGFGYPFNRSINIRAVGKKNSEIECLIVYFIHGPL